MTSVELSAEQLSVEIARRAPAEAVRFAAAYDAGLVSQALERLNASTRWGFLHRLPVDRREAVIAGAQAEVGRQWHVNLGFEENSLGSLMDAPLGVFGAAMTIGEAVEELRTLVKRAFITYLFVTDDENRLSGVVVMREMLLGDRGQTLGDIMLRNPFHLRPEMALTDAMKAVLNRHYPVYPVCDEAGRLVGLIRGQTLFEAQAIEISAQAGAMVGVEKEERLSTPWPRSLKFRHPWLQLNLLTAFVAAAVVGTFQDTIDRIVVLAVFLPVLAGQSGNTGCQALAVALRGLTLGELKSGRERALVLKEGLLGLLNGVLVGITAGIGMYVYVSLQSGEDPSSSPLTLGVIVATAMAMSCVISGISGALIPLALKKLGADPATASSIFLTTATDVASMGIFLGLATLLV